jgi:hypothetical protein
MQTIKTVYLKDGTKAALVAQTDKGYVVDPIEVYRNYMSEDEESEEYEETSGKVKLVDAVYAVAPKDVIEEEYKQILQKVEEQEKLLIEKRSELSKAKHELSQIERQKTDLSKMIINRTEIVNAKRLIVWIKGRIAPRIMDVKSSLKLTVSYSISRYAGAGEEKCWAYSAWSDYDGDKAWSTYSEYFDPTYGIKADLTDEEILEITHNRQMNDIKEFDNWEIERCDEKWLTHQNIERKRSIIEKSNETAIRNAEQELITLQEKINKLKGLTVS